MRQIYILYYILFQTTLCFSQNLGLNMVNSVHQGIINPAYTSDHKWELGVGSFMADLGTSGIKFSDVFSKDASGKYEIKNLDISKLQDRNRVSGSGELSTITLMYQSGALGFSAGHALKVNGDLDYTRDLVKLAINGNAPYVGETLNLGTLINAQSYNELFFGAALDLGMLSVGAKVKYVNGVQHISTLKSDIAFETDDEIYLLKLKTDIDVRSAGVLSYNGIDDTNFDFNSKSFDNFLKNNKGMLFDFGLDVKVNDRIHVFASIVDIGNINWDRQTFRYISNKDISFEGIDLADYLTEAEGEVSLTDTLYSLLDLTKIDEDFSTTVGADTYLGGTLKISEKWSAAAVLSHKKVGDLSSALASFQATRKINKLISIGGSYNLRDRKFTNIGLVGDLRIGPAYGFVTMDNIMAIIGYQNVNTANIRVGASLAF